MGRYIGLDPGERRVGVAVSDPTGTIASPHGFIDVHDGHVVEEIRDLCVTLEAAMVVIGLPIRLDGTEGPAAERARALGTAVSSAVDIEVAYHDERFTTVTAEAALIEGGVRRAARTAKRDQVAAAVMLQGFLDGRGRDRQVDDGGQHDGA
jgi:putative Holliday junction resolvase